MQPLILIATADLGLLKSVQLEVPRAFEGVFGVRPMTNSFVSTADEAERAWPNELRETSHERCLLVIDARLPPRERTTGDPEGAAALQLLQQIRRDNQTPALVLTTRTHAMPEIDAYCKPDNAAIAMPVPCLGRPEVVEAFLGMLQRPRPRKTWDTIEVDVRRDGATLHLGANGRLSEWGIAASYEFYPVAQLADNYEDYKVLEYRNGRLTVIPRWIRSWHQDGSQLFRDLILQGLGTGLFYHIEQAAGGLKGLAFRFRVKDPKLHNAPFEATVRISDPHDIENSPFVLVHAPIARWMGVANIRAPEAAAAARVRRPARMLFIRSQVGDEDAPTISDTLPVLKDGPDGLRRIHHYAFRRLENIDMEYEALRNLSSHTDLFEMPKLLDLEAEACRKDASKALREGLEAEYEHNSFCWALANRWQQDFACAAGRRLRRSARHDSRRVRRICCSDRCAPNISLLLPRQFGTKRCSPGAAQRSARHWLPLGRARP